MERPAGPAPESRLQSQPLHEGPCPSPEPPNGSHSRVVLRDSAAGPARGGGRPREAAAGSADGGRDHEQRTAGAPMSQNGSPAPPSTTTESQTSDLQNC